jgi:hypothetical protein
MTSLLPVSGTVRCPRFHSGVLPAPATRLPHCSGVGIGRVTPIRILILMNASTRAITAALAVTMPVHAILIISGGIGALALLVYLGIALPAVWSAKSARRKAAAAVLREFLSAFTHTYRR